MRKAAIGLLALAGIAFGGCETEEKPKPTSNQPMDVLVIKENECKESCGGRICYENVAYRAINGQIQDTNRYTITLEGFNNVDKIGERFIIADECIFYRKSAGKELVMERLK